MNPPTMNEEKKFPLLPPGYYIARMPLSRPNIVEFCIPAKGEPHWRNAQDDRMYYDPREIGAELTSMDPTPPASAPAKGRVTVTRKLAESIARRFCNTAISVRSWSKFSPTEQKDAAEEMFLALVAAIGEGEASPIILTSRYLKSRAISDETYSSHSEGWDDAMNEVDAQLTARGIPFKWEDWNPNPPSEPKAKGNA